MGTKSCKSKKKQIIIGPQFWDNNAYNNSNKYEKYSWDTYSSSQQTQDDTESTVIPAKTKAEKIEKTEKKQNEELVPFKFEWKGLGSRVILAGAFLQNWTKYEPMIKNPQTKVFEKIIKLPKTKHYFKFIVDNKWVCSNQYPTIMDNSNNKNNFIDLTNYTPPKELIQIEDFKKGELKPHRNKVIVLDMKDKTNYNCKFPDSHELNSYAPSTIIYYKESFDLDYQSNQKIIKKINKKKKFRFKVKNTLNENNTYKKILPFPHEKLMHFCQNINDLNNWKKNYLRGSTTIRNKHKYLTIVYYKPKPNWNYFT